MLGLPFFIVHHHRDSAPSSCFVYVKAVKVSFLCHNL